MRARLTNRMQNLFKFQLVRLQGLELKGFKETLNGLTQNIWKEVNSCGCKEVIPRVLQS